jgi:ferrous iron transport protein B
LSVVAAVGLVIYLLPNFPRLDAERMAYSESIADQHTGTFFDAIGKDNPYAAILEKTGVNAYAVYQTDYKNARMHTRGVEEKTAIDNKCMKRNGAFFRIANRGRYEQGGRMQTDGHALRVSREYRHLDGKRMEIKANIKEETINGSILGRLGRALEPVSRYAGFNWRVNVALISAFAAKENSVATLGTIYQASGEEDKSLGCRMMEKEKEWTPLHALALIKFMTMYPPCIATLLMIKVESGSWKWALFASFYPVVAGSLMAALVFTGGNLLGLNGMQAMVAFYLVALLGATGLGFIKKQR